MGIALLVAEYPPEPGGVSRSAERIANGLVDAGARVVVITKDSRPTAPSPRRETPRDGVIVLRFPFGSFYPNHWARELLALYEHLDASPPSLVHAMGSLRFGQIALAVGRRYAAPVVYGMRGADVNLAALHHPGRFAAVARGATALTAVSRTLAERALARMPAPRHVEVIANAVPFATSTARDAVRAELDLASDTTWIGARLSSRWTKGAGRLLHILQRVAFSAAPRLGLCLFGAADATAYAAAWRAGGDESARPYRYVGEVAAARMPDVLSALDLLLLTSHYEGMPNLLLEALSVGTAVAATPAGGCRDVLEDSGAGLLLPWDAGEAADAITAALAGDSLATMRGVAQSHVRANYAPAREVRAYASLYRSLLALGAPLPV